MDISKFKKNYGFKASIEVMTHCNNVAVKVQDLQTELLEEISKLDFIVECEKVHLIELINKHIDTIRKELYSVD